MYQETKTDTLRILAHGIRVNGAKTLVKCWYSIDGDTVRIYARGYSDKLPRDILPVQNDTDIMTDYFDEDSAALTSAHPLYPFFRAAAIREKLAFAKKHPAHNATIDSARAEEAARLSAELETLPSGQPTPADVDRARAYMDSQRRAAAEAEERARREEWERRTEVARQKEQDARETIAAAVAAYPLKDGAPYVVIRWSEHPGIDEGLTLSVAAADLMLSHLDEVQHARRVNDGLGGYDKTAFVVHYSKDGEPLTFADRYDIGDGIGGLIEDIRHYDSNLAEMLEAYGPAFTAPAEQVSTEAAGRVLSFAVCKSAREYKQMDSAADSIAGLLLDILGAAASYQPPRKDTPQPSGRVLTFHR